MKNHIIKIKTLGCFEIQYNQQNLLKGKAKESQFSLLLQCILHAATKQQGVSREELEDIIFKDREIENRHHALQSVIYNAKKKLENLGLPKMDFFSLKEGVYYWTDEIEIIEDAKEFDEACKVAQNETDINKKVELYLVACNLYTGEFLKDYISVFWISKEAEYYKNKYKEAVRECSILLKSQGKYYAMYELGCRAAEKVQFAEFEKIGIEALTLLGKYDEANVYFKKVSKEYEKIHNQVTSKFFRTYLDSLANSMRNPVSDMASICADLEDTVDESRAFFCNYFVFKGLYQLLLRTLLRKKRECCLVLCTLCDSDKEALAEKDVDRSISENMKKIICETLRRGDIVTRYGNGQYILLLYDVNKEQCKYITRRITEKFGEIHNKNIISYSIKEVGK